jgi:hypothetical protein
MKKTSIISTLIVGAFLTLLSITQTIAQNGGVYTDGEQIYRFRPDGRFELYSAGHKRLIGKGSWELDENVLTFYDKSGTAVLDGYVKQTNSGFTFQTARGKYRLKYLGDNSDWDILVLTLWAVNALSRN